MPRALLAIVTLVLVGGLASPAAAGRFDATFAELAGVAPSAVADTTAYELASGAYTHVVIGRARRAGAADLTRAFLLRCDRARCAGTPIALPRGDIEVLGVIDLEGAAVAFPARPLARSGAERLGAPRMKHPVLVVRTTRDETRTVTDRARRQVTGTQRERSLALVSLARATRLATTLFDEPIESTSPAGAGFVTTLSFERARRGPLVLVASEQRRLDHTVRCLPPPPTITRYRIAADGRYARTGGLPSRAGC